MFNSYSQPENIVSFGRLLILAIEVAVRCPNKMKFVTFPLSIVAVVVILAWSQCDQNKVITDRNRGLVEVYNVFRDEGMFRMLE